MMSWQFFVLFVAMLFVGMLIAVLAGWRIAVRHRARGPDGIWGKTGAVDGAIFGLMGLLLAFTFSGAATRFEARRALIAEEANAIGTSYLRLDLLPPETQPPLREAFRRYVRSRLEVYDKIPDVDAVKAALRKSAHIQNEIWQQTVAAAQKSDRHALMALALSSLNQMIDITTTRTVAFYAHPPQVIFIMLGVTVLVSSLLAGYSMSVAGRPSTLHIMMFILLVGVSVYVILDFEYPRIGLIRIDPIDSVLVDTLERMK